MNYSNLIISVSAMLVLSACGGGGGGTPATPTTVVTPVESTDPQNPGANQTADLLLGRFVDSAVEGLQYSTATQNGETEADGIFYYLEGESIVFSIGDTTLPETAGAEIITPLDVFSTEDITDIRVMNLARLLQSLDSDSNPINGIELTEAARSSATGLSLDFSSPTFDDEVVNLVANSGSSNTTLVSGMDALDHLQETLFLEGIDERPAMPSEVETESPPEDTQNSTTHPAVGSSGEFSDFSHDISGTLTVVDDRTIEISNFNYDGGGVRVFFYYGTDGNYRDGGPIGSQLNGRPYVNETITITLPDNLTLDDFNGISVWCIPFFVNFGDASF